jgi:hypothetical protein
VVPVRFAGGVGKAVALGIAPRLRLPLPEVAGPAFRDWVASVAGPRNRQYQYLRPARQAGHGVTRPVAAFVILDRQDAPCAARLEPVAPDRAMDALLHQNFTRDRHSADVLRAMAAMLTTRPTYRLRYAAPDEAVACLAAGCAAMPVPATDPGAGAGAAPVQTFRIVTETPPAPPAIPDGVGLRQRPGTVAVPIGGTLYLADAEGRAIHRMDALAEAIWELLAEPIPGTALVGLLVEAFPDADAAQIAGDVAALIRRLGRAGLIEGCAAG